MKNQISFDTLMNAALIEHQRNYMASLPSLEELAKAYKPSEGFVQRLQRSAEKKPKPALRVLVRRVAAGIVIVLALNTVVFVPVQAVRHAVVSTVIEWSDNFARFIFSSGEGGKQSIPSSVSFSYLPESFGDGSVDLHNEQRFIYTNSTDTGEYILFEILQADESNKNVFVDNEQSRLYSLEYEGQYFTCIESEGLVTLIWPIGTTVNKLVTSLPLSEALRVATGIVM